MVLGSSPVTVKTSNNWSAVFQIALKGGEGGHAADKIQQPLINQN